MYAIAVLAVLEEEDFLEYLECPRKTCVHGYLDSYIKIVSSRRHHEQV